MGHTRNAVVINAPYGLVFDISNDIERWTELFGDEYVKAEILERNGEEITFRLTDDENKSWVSKRWLHKEQFYAFASRHDPLFPFKYMKIIWLYHVTPEGTLMTWIQDFELDPKFTAYTDGQIEGFINEHSRQNMKIFKDVIEKESQELASQRL
ncbi:MAG TPA: polyketide cyclase [Candidatus Omnitrophota bacterium]|nr:polyketide cyclase [Candidatus Omnitrophota bacterium]HQO58332.1 polyketide cyclase [Candidatus Omnitrophota bacterium]